MTPTPLFSGEVQFRRYSDTSTQGQQIVLQVASRADLEPFIGKEGKRFMAVLVEIGDDEQPVEPKAAEKPKGGPLAKLAGMWCNDPDFRAWLNGTFESADLVHSAEEAAGLIRYLCACESRAELDNSPEVKARFDRLIRGPYSKHLAACGVTA